MKPTEVRAVVKLLEAEHEDVEELAKEVLRTIDEMRSDDRLYVLHVFNATGHFETWGPYPTAKQAVKGAQEALQGSSVATYKPAFLFRPGHGSLPVPSIPLCGVCTHPSWTHGFPRGLGCAIRTGGTEKQPVYCRCSESP